MGQKFKYNMAEEVFLDISNSVSAFKGLDYDELGELGTQLKSVISKSTV
jgi:NADH-quinone oxidoreductase subunit G